MRLRVGPHRAASNSVGPLMVIAREILRNLRVWAHFTRLGSKNTDTDLEQTMRDDLSGPVVTTESALPPSQGDFDRREAMLVDEFAGAYNPVTKMLP